MNCDSKDSNAVSKLCELEKVDIDFEHYVKRADKAEKEIEELTETIKKLLAEAPKTKHQKVPEELEKLRNENTKLKHKLDSLQHATAEIQSMKMSKSKSILDPTKNMLSCNSQACDDAGKLCDALGAQFVVDIKIDSAEELLDERVNKSQRIQKLYADDENFQTVMTKRGPRRVKNYYLMGQDITKETAAEISTILLKRDGPQFLELTAANADQIGAMFVPKYSLPSTKFVSPEMKEEVLKENPDNKKLFGEKIANDGEMAEKVVEEALWEVYGNAKGGILVIKNIKMMKLDAKRKEKEQEVDFFVVHFANQTITNIEVKSRLGKSSISPPEEWSTTRAKKQLAAIKLIFAS